jgi:TfoX/Sxy family transcriptional regulator of competence genes
MPYDEGLANRLREALGGRRRLEEKRMFGGLTFMVRGKMCVSVGKGRIMGRIDPAMHDAAIQRQGCRTVVMKGREYRGFVYVNTDAVRTRQDLDYWMSLAIDNNDRAKSKKRNR